MSSSIPQGISVVVPAYFAGEVLRNTLESILKQDYPSELIELIVVVTPLDNEAITLVSELKSQCGVNIRLEILDSVRVTVRRNHGIRISKNGIVGVIDDDIVLAANTFKNAFGHLQSDEKVAAVVYPTLEGKGLLSELNNGRYLGIVDSVMTTSPSTFFKKDALERIGLFREDMGPPISIHEDWELGTRIWKKGFKIKIDGNIVSIHLGQYTTRSINQKKSDGHNDESKKNIRFIKGYVSNYINLDYKSFFNVMKSSPPSEILSYSLYFITPVLIFVLLSINAIWALLYLCAIVIGANVHSIVKNRFKTFGLRKRLAYPVLLLSIRILRTYLSVIGLIVSIIR